MHHVRAVVVPGSTGMTLRSAASRVLSPWHQPPCGAGVLGPQVESIDQRLARVEQAVLDLRADVASLVGLPVTMRATVDTMAARVEQLDSAVTELRAHVGQR